MTPLTKLLNLDKWYAFPEHNWSLHNNLKAKVRCEIQKAKKVLAEIMFTDDVPLVLPLACNSPASISQADNSEVDNPLVLEPAWNSTSLNTAKSKCLLNTRHHIVNTIVNG